jgi:integrase
MVADLLAIWQREHVAKKADAERYVISIQHLLRFFAAQRQDGAVTAGVTVADVNARFVERFIMFRRAEGVGGHTISRDLAALRGALNYAWRNEHITTVPFVGDVDRKEKAKPRDLVYTPREVARLLDAAARLPERAHVFLYIMIALSTCGRSEAILDLQGDQIGDGLIRFLERGRAQTSKRRSIVPIAPTLAPWLRGITGKVIVYRAAIAEKRLQHGGPTHFQRDSYDIGKAFEGCLIEAGICDPVLDADGEPVLLPARAKLGETEPRARLKGRGTPNTLRHTIMTEMHKRGVPEAQIEMAAGHVGEGTNKRNYRHLRPDYLAELMAAIEDYWAEVGKFTQAHARGELT